MAVLKTLYELLSQFSDFMVYFNDGGLRYFDYVKNTFEYRKQYIFSEQIIIGNVKSYTVQEFDEEDMDEYIRVVITFENGTSATIDCM